MLLVEHDGLALGLSLFGSFLHGSIVVNDGFLNNLAGFSKLALIHLQLRLCALGHASSGKEGENG